MKKLGNSILSLRRFFWPAAAPSVTATRGEASTPPQRDRAQRTAPGAPSCSMRSRSPRAAHTTAAPPSSSAAMSRRRHRGTSARSATRRMAGCSGCGRRMALATRRASALTTSASASSRCRCLMDGIAASDRSLSEVCGQRASALLSVRWHCCSFIRSHCCPLPALASQLVRKGPPLESSTASDQVGR